MTDQSFTPLPDTSPDASDIIGPDPSSDKPHVRFVEVSTLSGSATLFGNSQAMGNDADTALFLGLRERADVIVVGSGTVSIEDYGGAQPTKERPTPAPIAVVTNSFNVDPQSKFVTEAITPPFVIANDKSMNFPEYAEMRVALRQAGVEFMNGGAGSAHESVLALSGMGLNMCVCEGCVWLFGLFIADHAVFQMYLTLAPKLTDNVVRTLVSVK